MPRYQTSAVDSVTVAAPFASGIGCPITDHPICEQNTRVSSMRTLSALLCFAACVDGSETPPDGPSLFDAPPDAIERRVGEIFVVERLTSGAGVTVAGAFFGIDRDTTLLDRDDGPCRVKRTNHVAAIPRNAGTVTISGGAMGSIALVPSPNNNYAATFQEIRFAANDVLSIVGDGGEVPSFSGTISFPSTFMVISPNSLSTLSKSGFTATWTPTVGLISIVFTQYPSGAPQTFIKCVFDGTAGTAAIPASALTDLTSGASAGVSIATESRMVSSAGPYELTFSAFFTGLTASATVQP